jgi:hypothetical protein
MAKTSTASREDEDALSSHAQGTALRALARLLGRRVAARQAELLTRRDGEENGGPS